MPRPYVRSAQTPSKQYPVSLIAMGHTPLPGFSSLIKSPSSRKASRGTSAARMILTSSRVTSRAVSDDWRAAQIISNFHPDGPAAVPWWWADTVPTTSSSCSRASCSASSAAPSSAAPNGAAAVSAGSAACKLVCTCGSRVSAGWLSCSARAARWIERF